MSCLLLVMYPPPYGGEATLTHITGMQWRDGMHFANAISSHQHAG